MVKLIGAAMIIISSASVGGFIYKTMKNRRDCLKNLLTGIDILQAEIVFRRSELSVAVKRVREEISGPVSQMFGQIHELMEQGGTFSAAYGKAVQITMQAGLLHEDIDILNSITGILGRYDSFEQAQMLKNVRVALEKQYNESRDELAQKGKLYRAMGLSFGIMLALIAV